MDYSLLGLSPKELGDINNQQIQRQRNIIDLLGKSMNYKVASARQQSDAERNAALNRLTETQIYQNQPVTITVGGKNYQTTRGNMTLAMQQLSRGMANQAQAERSKYENQLMEIEINGQLFQIPRHEFKDMAAALAKQEELGIERDRESRLQEIDNRIAEGIKSLSNISRPEDITAEQAAKTGVLDTWMRQRSNKKSAADEANRQNLRKTWAKLHNDLNKAPDKFANLLAASQSANAIAEELGENIASVVFPEGFNASGFSNDIPKNGVRRMDKLKNPKTGKLLTIREVREQAEKDGMSLNEALQILYLHDLLKKEK